MYLLDTNTCIFIKNQKPAHVLERLRTSLSKGVFLSSVSVAEMQYGVYNSSNIEKQASLKELLDSNWKTGNNPSRSAIIAEMLIARCQRGGEQERAGKLRRAWRALPFFPSYREGLRKARLFLLTRADAQLKLVLPIMSLSRYSSSISKRG